MTMLTPGTWRVDPCGAVGCKAVLDAAPCLSKPKQVHHPLGRSTVGAVRSDRGQCIFHRLFEVHGAAVLPGTIEGGGVAQHCARGSDTFVEPGARGKVDQPVATVVGAPPLRAAPDMR